MAECLAEIGVAVIGGDQRQFRVVEELANRVAWIRTYGLEGSWDSPRVKMAEDLESAVSGVGVVLFPINAINSKGTIRTRDPERMIFLPEDFWTWLEPGTLVFTGSIPENIRDRIKRAAIRVVEYADCDQVAIPNAIPTAEGAIQLAMEAIPVTLYGNPCLILGYGRVAQALAKMLLGIGAEVYIAARNPIQLQRAAEAGCKAMHLKDLSEKIPMMWAIFNSIPAMVLPREIVSCVKKEAIIIDLASAPGGTDFDAATSHGIRSILALGLPGKVAPQTAGEILASTLPDLMEQELAHRAVWEAER